MRRKKQNRMLAALLATGIAAVNAMLIPINTHAQIPADQDVAEVFFDATKSPLTFNKTAESLWDVYDDVIGKPEGVDYTLVLSSPTDAQITEDGVLQVDYDGRNDTAASAAGNYDGTYTIWGIGGFSCQNGDKLTYRIRTTAGDAHIADLMSIKFFMGGTVVLESTFQQWLEDAVVEIDGAAPADKTLITDGNWHSYTMQLAGATAECQGMKIYFDRGEYSGTVYFGPVTCDKGAGTENIDDFVISGRTNSYQDPVDQFYPLIRSKAYNNGIGTGATSGCNIHNSRLWTMSTSDANIVQNALSGNVKALQIAYQNTATHATYTRLKAAETVTDETLMGISLKGADSSTDLSGVTATAKVDELVNVVLYNGNTKQKTIPFTDFYELDKLDAKNHTDLSASEYKTYYSKECAGVTFDTVAFEIKDSGTNCGKVFVQDIFFPRYSYTVNYYYDGVKDTTATVTGTDKADKQIAYPDKNKTGYHKEEVKENGSLINGTPVVTTTAGGTVIDVYYVKDAVVPTTYPYTVEYYYDGVKDTSATVTGTAEAGTEIKYSTVPKDGYKWEKVTVDGTNTTEKAFVKAVTDGNVVRVYFVTDTPEQPEQPEDPKIPEEPKDPEDPVEPQKPVKASYVVRYYVDGKLVERVERSGKIGQAIPYSKERSDSTFEKITGQKTVTRNSSKNILNVYFVTAVAPKPVPDTSQNDSVPQTTAAPVLPKTGDTTGLFVWTVLAAAALAVCVGLGVKRKIRRK